METERIALNQRERERLEVLYEVKLKHLTQVEAAKRLRVTDRHVRRLLLALAERGDGAMVHGLRGRASNRKLQASFEQRILTRVRQRYADFGPTLAAEHLAKEGLAVSRETLRRWMTRAQLWRPRAQRVKAIHVWRERRACFGELVMKDSSPFRWLEERGPAGQLIAVIDVRIEVSLGFRRWVAGICAVLSISTPTVAGPEAKPKFSISPAPSLYSRNSSICPESRPARSYRRHELLA